MDRERPEWRPLDPLRSAVDLGKLALATLIHRAAKPRVPIQLPTYPIEAPVQYESDLLQGRLPLWDDDESL